MNPSNRQGEPHSGARDVPETDAVGSRAARGDPAPVRRTLVALATYNEIDNLPGLVAEIFRVLPAADVLVVDDNSPDGTGDWCDEASQTEPRLKCIRRSGKLGLGTAALAAIRRAVAEDYEILVTMDADWSHDPVHLRALLSAIELADVAIGSRYCPGGAIENWPLSRRVMSRGINSLTRLALGLPVGDSSGAYRAYRVGRLRDLRLDDLRATGYAYLEELLWHLHRVGATFAEVPITFRERRAGASKAGVSEAWGKLGTLIRLKLVRD